MKHIGVFLILVLICNFVDLCHPENSALHGTGYKGNYQCFVPTFAASTIFVFLEAIYWIFVICIK